MFYIKRTKFTKIALTVLIFATLVLVGCVGPRGWPGTQITGDTIYVASKDGRVLALSPDSGTQKWSWPSTGAQSSGSLGCSGGGQFSAGKYYGSPIVVNGSVYIGGYNGNVYAIANGTEEWIYNIGSHIAGDVAVADNTLFVGTSAGKLYALDIATDTPQEKFTYQAGDKIWSTPVVQDGVVYFGSLDHKLYALDATTGEVKWEFETKGGIVSAPLVVEGIVYVGSLDNNFYAIYAETGKLKWAFDEAGNWFWAKALYDDGKIYAGCLDHYVYALDAGNGTPVWSFKASGPISTSPVIAGGLMVVASEDGKVYGLNIKTSEKEWQFDDIEAKVLSSISTDGEKVYINAGDNKLYAIDVQTGKLAWSVLLSK